MGERGGGSGTFAWCVATGTAVVSHILLLLSVPPTPREQTLSSATAISWEAFTPAESAESRKPAASAADTLSQLAAAASTPALTPLAATSTTSARRATPRPRTGEVHAVSASAEPPTAAEAATRARPETALSVDDNSGAAVYWQRRLPVALSEHSAASSTALTAAASGAAAAGAAISGNLRSSAGRRPLQRTPRLLSEPNPCAGYFPGRAAADRGQVQLSIDVDAQGHSHPRQTLSEYPRDQGFESAAKACATHLHFAPAVDEQGQPIAAQARVALSFDRS